MVRCARAWGLIAAIGGAQACVPDSSGLGSEGTAIPVDPSSTGSDVATTTGATTTAASVGTTADDTTVPGSTSTGDPPATTEGSTTTAAGSGDTQSGPMDVEYCFDVNASIPDDNAAGIGSSFSVEEAGIVLDVGVTVVADHPWVGDLVFELRSPADTTLAVIDRPGVVGMDNGCSGDDIDVMLSDDAAQAIDAACLPEGGGTPAIGGTLLPDHPFAPAFQGQPTAGTWRMRAIDQDPASTGTFVRWCLRLTYE